MPLELLRGAGTLLGTIVRMSGPDIWETRSEPFTSYPNFKP
jgi:hypothetical protein